MHCREAADDDEDERGVEEEVEWERVDGCREGQICLKKGRCGKLTVIQTDTRSGD